MKLLIWLHLNQYGHNMLEEPFDDDTHYLVLFIDVPTMSNYRQCQITEEIQAMVLHDFSILLGNRNRSLIEDTLREQQLSMYHGIGYYSCYVPGFLINAIEEELRQNPDVDNNLVTVANKMGIGELPYLQLILVELEHIGEVNSHFLSLYEAIKPHLIIGVPARNCVNQTDTPLLEQAWQEALEKNFVLRDIYYGTGYSAFTVPNHMFKQILSELQHYPRKRVGICPNIQSAPAPIPFGIQEKSTFTDQLKQQREFVIFWNNSHENLTPIELFEIHKKIISYSYFCLMTLGNKDKFATYGEMKIHRVEGKGDCLFLAVEDQLLRNNLPVHNAVELRKMAVEHMRDNADQYMNFTEDNQSFAEYLKQISTRYFWCGEQVVRALSIILDVEIVVYNVSSDQVRILPAQVITHQKPIFYLMFNHGNHYDSIAVPSNALLSQLGLPQRNVDEQTPINSIDLDLVEQSCIAILTENLTEDEDYYTITVSEKATLLLVNAQLGQIHSLLEVPEIRKNLSLDYQVEKFSFPKKTKVKENFSLQLTPYLEDILERSGNFSAASIKNYQRQDIFKKSSLQVIAIIEPHLSFTFNNQFQEMLRSLASLNDSFIILLYKNKKKLVEHFGDLANNFSTCMHEELLIATLSLSGEQLKTVPISQSFSAPESIGSCFTDEKQEAYCMMITSEIRHAAQNASSNPANISVNKLATFLQTGNEDVYIALGKEQLVQGKEAATTSAFANPGQPNFFAPAKEAIGASAEINGESNGVRHH